MRSNRAKNFSIPKVDEELGAQTRFEPVAVEARPAKAKSKMRNKLKWKTGYSPMPEESPHVSAKASGSDKPLHLNMMIGPDTAPVKESTTEEESLTKDKAHSSDDLQNPQQFLWVFTRKVLEELLIWLIIFIILINQRIQR
ncbi:unnamed protein product [Gongylonema pulchrum]|uniref:Ovule protein n=1 Tax=Gongylonema pulchrum TaxID=637853 RepID=A0A183DKJ8_9BILA|nr:unnamed protein product [Gongylonema pulchrum]